MELIYFYETVYDSGQFSNLAKIKINGDRWCNRHCFDIHTSELWFDDVENKKYLKFRFRLDSDLTAFQIGFSPHDYV